jgi:hypothetical protein
MNTLVITSTRENAGKTSLIVGLSRVLSGSAGYLKPFGDRLQYREKRLWDYDSALCASLFDLRLPPEKLSLGFDPSKLRFKYSPSEREKKLRQLATASGKGKTVLFVESGQTYSYGVSLGLDALSICRLLKARLLVVAHGHWDRVSDDLALLKEVLKTAEVDVWGVVINQVKDPQESEQRYRPYLDELELPVLGALPYRVELTRPTMAFLAAQLQAKVLAAEPSLYRVVGEIFVGAMSSDAVLRMQRFRRRDKLIITSGDRSDMILAAIETGAAGIILTNNILPPPNIIAHAAQAGIPLLLVANDTYQAAKKVDHLVPLLAAQEEEKLSLLETLVRDHLQLGGLVP